MQICEAVFCSQPARKGLCLETAKSANLRLAYILPVKKPQTFSSKSNNMKTPLPVLALLCLFSNQINAQAWQQQNPNFPGSTFVQEVIAPAGSAAWAYGFEYGSTGNWRTALLHVRRR